MPKLFSKYWYRDYSIVADAFLYNARDKDLHQGGTIAKGEIVAGKCGYAVAETSVPGLSASTQPYWPNRCVDWQGHFLTCMALDGLPAGPALHGKSSDLRHRHYVVAELPSSQHAALAKKVGLKVIQSEDGRSLVNLEIFTVPGRTPTYRRAKLL